MALGAPSHLPGRRPPVGCCAQRPRWEVPRADCVPATAWTDGAVQQSNCHTGWSAGTDARGNKPSRPIRSIALEHHQPTTLRPFTSAYGWKTQVTESAQLLNRHRAAYRLRLQYELLGGIESVGSSANASAFPTAFFPTMRKRGARTPAANLRRRHQPLNCKHSL